MDVWKCTTSFPVMMLCCCLKNIYFFPYIFPFLRKVRWKGMNLKRKYEKLRKTDKTWNLFSSYFFLIYQFSMSYQCVVSLLLYKKDGFIRWKFIYFLSRFYSRIYYSRSVKWGAYNCRVQRTCIHFTETLVFYIQLIKDMHTTGYGKNRRLNEHLVVHPCKLSTGWESW